MKITSLDLKKNLVKVVVTNIDDLWHLSNIIQKGDKISGQTSHKLKLGGEDEKARSVKKFIFLTIEAEKIEYSTDSLKVIGKVLAGPEDISPGSMHSIDIKQGSEIKIEKDVWPQFLINRLKESESKIPEILILVLDDSEANFATLSASGIKNLAHMSLELSKKRYETDKKVEKEKFSELLKKLKLLDSEINPKTILIASPIFWKEVVSKEIIAKHSELKSKIKTETVSTGSKRSINELLTSGALDKIIKAGRLQKEALLVDEFLKRVAKDHLVTYGFDHVKNAVEAGAVETLLVTDKLITDLREKDDYKKLEDLMIFVEKNKGEVNIISYSDEPGKKLHGLSGIGALLRYEV